MVPSKRLDGTIEPWEVAPSLDGSLYISCKIHRNLRNEGQTNLVGAEVPLGIHRLEAFEEGEDAI